jgi:hypothetical protein
MTFTPEQAQQIAEIAARKVLEELNISDMLRSIKQMEKLNIILKTSKKYCSQNRAVQIVGSRSWVENAIAEGSIRVNGTDTRGKRTMWHCNIDDVMKEREKRNAWLQRRA